MILSTEREVRKELAQLREEHLRGVELTANEAYILGMVEDAIFNQLMSRSQFLQKYMDPKRDINKECHYPNTGEISPEKYRELYERDAIAARVVEVFVKESWQFQPEVYEDEDPKKLTPFEEDWRNVTRSLRGESWYKDDEGNPIWDHIIRADILSGIGHYGVIFLGLDDVQDESELRLPVKGLEHLDQPVANLRRKTDVSKTRRKLLFLREFDQSTAPILEYETDKRSPRYGMPKVYQLKLSDPNDATITGVAGVPTGTVDVHWTRVIHLADDLRSSEIFAQPRLRPVLNRVLDLIKLYGGSAEMYWQGAFPGMSIETQPNLGTDVKMDVPAVRKEVQKYLNSLERVMMFQGVTARTLSPTVVDPTSQIDVQITAICIQLGIPKRIFMGSERGELASSQDATSWNGRIHFRQVNYLTPRVIVPLVDRLIAVGVLRPPSEGYHVAWPTLNPLSPQERAAIAGARMDAMAKYVAGQLDVLVSPMDFLTREMGLTEEEAKTTLENAKKHIQKANPEAENIVEGRNPTPSTPEGQQPPAMPEGQQPPVEETDEELEDEPLTPEAILSANLSAAQAEQRRKFLEAGRKRRRGILREKTRQSRANRAQKVKPGNSIPPKPKDIKGALDKAKTVLQRAAKAQHPRRKQQLLAQAAKLVEQSKEAMTAGGLNDKEIQEVMTGLFSKSDRKMLEGETPTANRMSLEEFIELIRNAKKKPVKKTESSAKAKKKAGDNCGTGAGGFKPGNKCASKVHVVTRNRIEFVGAPGKRHQKIYRLNKTARDFQKTEAWAKVKDSAEKVRHEGEEEDLLSVISGSRPAGFVRVKNSKSLAKTLNAEFKKSGIDCTAYSAGKAIVVIRNKDAKKAGRDKFISQVKKYYDKGAKGHSLTPKEHANVGKWLGYSPEEIKAYLTPPKKIDPKKELARALETVEMLKSRGYEPSHLLLKWIKDLKKQIPTSNAAKTKTSGRAKTKASSKAKTKKGTPGGGGVNCGTGAGGFKPGNVCAKGGANSKEAKKAKALKQHTGRIAREQQRYAEEQNEAWLAKSLGGMTDPDNKPTDVILTDKKGKVTHGIEVKTSINEKDRRINMSAAARVRKAMWEKENKALIHTVVIDDQEVFNANGKGKHDFSKRRIFYRRGIGGSARIDGMHEVKSIEELKKLIDTPENKLPKKARRTDKEYTYGNWIEQRDANGKKYFVNDKTGREVYPKA